MILQNASVSLGALKIGTGCFFFRLNLSLYRVTPRTKASEAFAYIYTRDLV